MSKPKILVLDIETSAILGHVWGLFDQTIPLNQVAKDWVILSWSAKWYKDASNTLYGPHDKVVYSDQRNNKNLENDGKILKEIWDLLNESDIVLTQNGRRFDLKRLNSRFILNGFPPVKPFKTIDTLVLVKKNFGFTSNKLEYLTDKLCTKYKKLKHKKFPGFELWKECQQGNKEAWNEMEKYNKWDILSLEELFHKLSPWDSSINFSLYNEDETRLCNCGSKNFIKRGFAFTTIGKFQRFVCQKCGAWSRGSVNLFSKEKRASLHRK